MNQDQPLNSDLQQAIDSVTSVESTPVAEPQIPETSTPVASEEVDAPVADSVPEEAAAPAMLDFSAPEPATPVPAEQMPTATEHSFTSSGLSSEMQQIKESALKELTPLLGNMDINPSQKFKIYHDILTILNDRSVIQPAYEAARDIADAKEKAEALLFLVEAIG